MVGWAVAYNFTMLDPAYVRDHQGEVRRGLQNRGWNVDGDLEQLATLENRRRRLIPSSKV